MGEFEPIATGRSISVQIAERIYERVQQGEFPVGTKLPSETELARQFGVSRPTVREALGALQFVGYIDSARGSGSRVVSVAPTLVQSAPGPTVVRPGAVIDLFAARLLVEPQVAALAALGPDPEGLDEAEALIEGMSVAVTQPGLHAETDLRVHRALAALCPNEFMRDSALNLVDAAASPSFKSIRHRAWADGELPSVWGHQQHQVLAAIRAGDAEAAMEASWSHLASAAENALTMLAGEPTVAAESRGRLSSILQSGPVFPLGVYGDGASGPLRVGAGRPAARRGVR